MAVDATVRGAGIFGLSVAWSLTLRGARVRVIDPNGVGAGASGGVVGALAPHVPENWNPKKAFQLDSLLMAEAYWAQVEGVCGLPSGYGRLGRVQPLADARAVDLARARIAGAQALWQGRAAWQVVGMQADAGAGASAEVSAEVSADTGADAGADTGADTGADRVAAWGAWRPHSPTGYYVYDTLSARMHPRMAAQALAEAIRVKGGEIVQAGREEGAVIWCTGVADLEAMSAARARPVGGGVKGQGALLRYEASGLPQIFAGGVHVVPHANGTVAVGSTSEREYSDARSTDAQLDAVIAAARAALPALADAPVIERWAGVRPKARSRAPMLGAHPLHKGAYIANGGFKIGFGMAPKAGEVMADLVLGGAADIPQGFEPEASF
ncbi:MAG: NAD(P)/FAD-dependent oxidoreductase [Paracoccaceae bacterium]